jgi:hypothetical protein
LVFLNFVKENQKLRSRPEGGGKNWELKVMQELALWFLPKGKKCAAAQLFGFYQRVKTAQQGNLLKLLDKN